VRSPSVSSATVRSPLAIGLDVADVERLKRMGLHWGERMMAHLFTPAERASLLGPSGVRWASLAGRFAAKEAARKVLASHGFRIGWTDVEVSTGPHGEPHLSLLGRAREAATSCGLGAFLLSISHERAVAVAVVLALPGDPPQHPTEETSPCHESRPG
jgi:holo-[acyl-carrier protein] synthase